MPDRHEAVALNVQTGGGGESIDDFEPFLHVTAAQQMIGRGAIHRRRVDTRDARRVKVGVSRFDATP